MMLYQLGYLPSLLATLSFMRGVHGATSEESLDDILKNWSKQPQASYPTQFTRGIIPVSRSLLDVNIKGYNYFL